MFDTMQEDQISFCRPEDDVVVVRVAGRGDFALSTQLKTLSAHFNRPDYSPRYVIDLEQCATLDSTFMGTMAAMALHQSSCRSERVVVVNSSNVTRRQMEMLGLKYILDLRDHPVETDHGAQGEFQVAAAPESSRFEQIVHMIESHQALVDACSGNEVKFNAVLQSLAESLEREKDRRGEGGSK